MSVEEIGVKLVDGCKKGENLQVIEKHYDEDVVSVEAAEMGEMTREVQGKNKVVAKNNWWFENNEVHAADAEGPFLHGEDQFAVIFEAEITPKVGPAAGNRVGMKEIGVFTVKNDKIVREEFFYTPGS